jgi:hypothetical protein
MTTDAQYADPLPNPYPKLVRLIDAALPRRATPALG